MRSSNSVLPQIPMKFTQESLRFFRAISLNRATRPNESVQLQDRAAAEVASDLGDR